ncbi:kinesin-like protein KIF9 [Histomonas meleagridis]|uniref:kinesin-like protein KIF9 n=1 Tax=Histomonas meleagridis TaxID=135588 RepID=UPI003559D2AE|nr:kinesin-like protein KIF9 [Histomonas meleagridis]KAH0797639.1 kinesin-like protein KIF9 [Histomonas meleagridis]
MTVLPIKVFIRTRPTTNFAGESIKIYDDHQTITVNIDKSDPLNFLNSPESNYSFKFHSVLHNVSQEIVFEEVAREIVDSFIQGYNGCIFCYGHRGSGKTFTMYGGIRHFKYRGIIPRSLSYIFQEITKFKTIQFTISIQYFQIYNNIIYDLLCDEEKTMIIAEDENGNTYVQNMSSHEITDVTQALQLLIDGDSKLHLMEHKHNRKVYRSHTVFVVEMISKKGTRMTHSRLQLLDLAAEDEASDSAYVNKSMSYLQQLVISINNHGKDHLPFRRSKLTYLLRDAIGGNCRTAVIANVWPEKENIKNAVSTFQFATQLSQVKNNSKVNIMEPPELRIERLQSELDLLHAECKLQDELGGAVRIDGLKQEDEAQVADLVGLYLANEIDYIPLHSVSHIKAIFAEIKRRYRDIPNIVMKEVSEKFTLTERAKSSKAQKEVGVIDDSGFSVGVAASQDRPNYLKVISRFDGASFLSDNKANSPRQPTQEQMFEIFKLRDGKSFTEELEKNKKETKDLIENKKKLVTEINSIQQQIVDIGKIIDRKGIRRRDKLFEDEVELLKKEHEFKKKYKEIYQEIQKTRCDINELKEKRTEERQKMFNMFQEWYEKWLNNELYTEKVVPPQNEAEAPAQTKENLQAKGKKKEITHTNVKGKATLRVRK